MSDDPRLKADVSAARTLRAEVPFVEVLKEAARDGSPIVRRIAADFLIQHLGPSATTRSVVECGQWAVGKLGGVRHES